MRVAARRTSGRRPLPYVPGRAGRRRGASRPALARRHAGVVRHLGRDGARRRQPGRAVRRRRTTTSCRWRTDVARRAGRRARALGGRGVDGADLAGAAAAGRAGAGARRRRGGRAGGDRRGRALGAGRVVAVARSTSRASGRRAAGADVVVPLRRRTSTTLGRAARRGAGRAGRRRARPGVRDRGDRRRAGSSAPGGRLVNLGGAAGDDGDLLLGGPAQPLGRACSATPTTP